MESQWITDVKGALRSSRSEMPPMTTMLTAILVAKGIVTVEELKEIESHFNER